MCRFCEARTVNVYIRRDAPSESPEIAQTRILLGEPELTRGSGTASDRGTICPYTAHAFLSAHALARPDDQLLANRLIYQLGQAGIALCIKVFWGNFPILIKNPKVKVAACCE